MSCFVILQHEIILQVAWCILSMTHKSILPEKVVCIVVVLIVHPFVLIEVSLGQRVILMIYDL